MVDEKRLKGNLAHRAFEQLFDCMGTEQWRAAQVDECLDEVLPPLFQQQGTPLLAYGKEPERVKFVAELRRAARELVRLLQENGWTPTGIEEELAGKFGNTSLKGYLDLVVKRGKEHCIIDLKWSGLSYRRNLINNQEDLQLAIYAHLLAERTRGPVHTAYYIMSKAKLLLRNKETFPSLATAALQPDSDALTVQRETLDRMRATYTWRREQLDGGRVEVRTADTAAALDSAYAEGGVDLLPFLEMKDTTNSFDDYRTLVQAFQ